MRAPDSASADKIPIRKGKWSPEEDDKLVAYIKRYGIWNWNEMPKAAGLPRSGKSCRLRWINYLRPNIKHGNFTKEEEEAILNLHQMLGNRWSAIAARLPGRTDNEIKNYWHAHLKKLLNNTTLSNHQFEENQTHVIQVQHMFFPENSVSGTSAADFSKMDDVVSPTVEKL